MDRQSGALIVTSNGAVTQQFTKGESTRQAFTSGAIIKGAAPAPAPPAPSDSGDAQPTPPPEPTPAPATSTIEYLDVAGKESGNNQQGFTLEGYSGKYKKVTRPNGTQYFEPMK
jgi:hypothetical protein